MPAGFLPLKEFDRDAWVVGVTYYPDPDVAVKVDYVCTAQSERRRPRAAQRSTSAWDGGSDGSSSCQ